MHMHTDLSTLERRLLFMATLLLVIGHFANLGLQPLYLEEPRRVIISMEMLANGNLIVPTLLGELYYNKPPVYNWLLIASTVLFGGWNEFALRLPTVLSLLLWCWVTYLVGRSQFGSRYGWYSALCLACCGAFLYYFSLLAEIDIFYSLLTWTSLVGIYFFSRHNRWWALFLMVYTAAGIGFLTKGLPSLAFAGISLVAWLVWTRQWKRLFSWAHLVSGLVFLGIVGGYYWWYAQYEDPTPFLTRLWSETSDRTLSESSGFLSFLTHLVTFPVNLWANLLPAGGLLIVFAFRQKAWRAFRQHDFLVFCGLVFAANVLIYWLTPAERLRYVYMLFPFLIFAFVWFWQQPDNARWAQKTLRWSSGLFIHLLPLGALAILWIPDLQPIPGLGWISAIFFLLFAAVALLFWRKPDYPMAQLILAIALSRWLFALTVLPQRNLDGGAFRDRARAERIHELVGDAPLHTEGEDKVIAYTSVAYLDKLRSDYVRRNDSLLVDRYYLVTPDSIVPVLSDTLLEYRYDGLEQQLIRVLPEGN